MKQLQFEYIEDASLKQELNRIDRWRENHRVSAILFHVFSDNLEAEKIRHVTSLIEFALPDALYAIAPTRALTHIEAPSEISNAPRV